MLVEEIYEGGHVGLKTALIVLSYGLLLVAFVLFCFGIHGFRIAYGRFGFESVITVVSKFISKWMYQNHSKSDISESIQYRFFERRFKNFFICYAVL